MFPDANILGIDLYRLVVVIGIVTAMTVARLLYKHVGMSFAVFRFAILVLIGAIFIGYVFAILFQSWYAYIETGVFEWGIGATFYGGFLGGAAVFLIGYFLFG